MNLREVQRPLKERYRDEPEASRITLSASRITLSARGSTTDQPVTCSVDIVRGVRFDRIEVAVEGDLDLRGTLGVERDPPVGFEAIRLRFEVDTPEASAEQLAALHEETERYCTVLQTLRTPPAIASELASG